MGDWLLHYLAGGLQAPGRALPMAGFRIAVALGCLCKFGSEWRRGIWTWFAPESFIGHEYRARPHRVTVSQPWFRVLLVLRMLAATALLLALFPRPAAAGLALWYLFELGYDAKYHTTLYLGAATVLAISPGTGACLTLHTLHTASQTGLAAAVAAENVRICDAFAQVLGVMLVCGLYFGSAYRKLRTPAFMSGMVLHRWFQHMDLIRRQLPHREDWFPAGLAGRLAAAPVRLWRAAAVVAVALEAALPVGLLVRPAWPFAVLLGLGMHAAFTMMYPQRIVPFTFATVGAYLLFLPPS